MSLPPIGNHEIDLSVGCRNPATMAQRETLLTCQLLYGLTQTT
jgi:hypothetical protein